MSNKTYFRIFIALLILLMVLGGLVYAKVLSFPAAKAKDCSNVAPAENAVVVQMINNTFEPREINVDVCATLLFLNLDDESKWPTVSSWRSYPGFDAGKELKKFDYFRFQVTRTGTYSFQDKMHNNVTGKIIIKDIK